MAKGASLPWKGSLRLVGKVRKADAIAFRIADIQGPAGAVDDFHTERGQLLLPLGPIARVDAQREEVEAAVRVAEGRGRALRVAGFERQELFARSHRQPHRSFAGPSVFPRPAAQDAQPERLDVEALGGG